MDAMTLLSLTRARLNQCHGRYAEISRQSGIPYSSLVKLAQGHAKNPTVDSLQSVIEALDSLGIPAPTEVISDPGSAVADPDESRIEAFEEAP